MNSTNHRSGKWYGFAVLIGLVFGIAAALFPDFSPSNTAIKYVGMLAAAILGVFSGRFAKMTGRRPSWFGMRVVWAFAIPIIVVGFLTVPSTAILLHHLNQTSSTLPLGTRQQIAKMMHSPQGMAVASVGSFATYFVIGIVFGWIGSLIGRSSQHGRQGV